MQTSGPAFGGAPLEDAGMMMGGGAQTRPNNSSMNVNQVQPLPTTMNPNDLKFDEIVLESNEIDLAEL